MPKIVKQDKSRVPFDEIKLKEGISRSLEKRPVSEEDFETPVSYTHLTLPTSPKV